MKLVLKQTGKALLYLILFFAVQVMVCIGMFFVYGVKVGLESAGKVPDNDALSVGAAEFLNNNLNLVAILSGCITIFCLWVFFKLIQNQKFLPIANIRTFKLNYVPIILLLGITTAFLIETGLSLLPESIMNEYAKSSQGLVNGSVIIVLLSTVIIAPIVEEIVFRGFILSSLRAAMPTAVAVIVTSAMFGVMHGQIVWICYTFVLGVLFSVTAVKTRSIAASMVYHATFNLCGILVPVLLPEFPMYMNAILAAVSFLFLILLLFLLVRLNKKTEVKVLTEA